MNIFIHIFSGMPLSDAACFRALVGSIGVSIIILRACLIAASNWEIFNSLLIAISESPYPIHMHNACHKNPGVFDHSTDTKRHMTKNGTQKLSRSKNCPNNKKLSQCCPNSKTQRPSVFIDKRLMCNSVLI